MKIQSPRACPDTSDQAQILPYAKSSHRPGRRSTRGLPGDFAGTADKFSKTLFYVAAVQHGRWSDARAPAPASGTFRLNTDAKLIITI